MVTGRLALAACRVILAACYAGAVLAPARLVAAVTEILLLSLLAAVTAAAWWRHCAPRPSPSFGPGPAAGPPSTRREPGPRGRRTTKGATCDH